MRPFRLKKRLRFESAGSARLLKRRPTPAAEHRMDGTLRLTSLLVVGVFLLLGLRLFQLQIVSGDQYYRKSTDNFVKELERPAVRGQIRDRNGQVLAENRPSYSVYVTPRYLTEDALQRLRKYLELSDEQFGALRKKIDGKRGLDRYRALLAFEDIGRDPMAMLESEKLALPGIDVEARPHRSYPNGPLLSHAIGYLNMIGADEMERRRSEGYRPGDYVGRSGLERLLEPQLRGVAGYEKVIVDARGQRKSDSELARLFGGDAQKEALPGHNIVLTLDLSLQRILQQALSRHPSAAAAVVDVESGRVLALGSNPAPDPNVLTGRLTRAEAERLEKDPYRPLLDKALRENYYPGSTFKIVPALAALEEGVVNPDEKVVCRGRYDLGRHAFHCMKAHGPMTMHDAIVQSCNIYFYHLAEKVGLDRMARMADFFGFGKPTGIGLGEVAGSVPNLDYYRKHGGFRVGYALNTALGQGDVKVTVLQLALAYAAVANGGRLYRPQLVDRIETPAGTVIKKMEPEVRGIISMSPPSADRLRRALWGVVNDPKGTSFTAHVEELDVAGKSGTAQVRKNHKGEAAGWDTGNDHAWFAGFAPSRHSKIAVAVLVEHGGLGGHVAAPTAMQIIQGYFHKVAPEQRPRLALDGEKRPPPVTPLPASAGIQ